LVQLFCRFNSRFKVQQLISSSFLYIKFFHNLMWGSFDVTTKFFRIWNILSNTLKSSSYFLIRNILLYEKIQQRCSGSICFNKIQQDLFKVLQIISRITKIQHTKKDRSNISRTYKARSTNRSNKSHYYVQDLA
jgi:hypothetical protein